MKFAHISDLHLGKRVNNFNLLNDQKAILQQILNIVVKENIKALLIAGDVYDRPVPPIEAVTLFNDFLTKLVDQNIFIYVISGNHDSGERLSFGKNILAKNNLFINCNVLETKNKYTLKDIFGNINIYLLPYLKQGDINKLFDENFKNFDEAVKKLVEYLNINKQERNILVSHQFVTHITSVVEESDSEIISIGGANNIDAEILEVFDYVALGHLHKSQKIYKDYIRYAGSPLKYSFSEVNHKKSITIVNMKEKGNIEISKKELLPERDMKKYVGSLNEIMEMKNNDNINKNDYVHITITDNSDIINLSSTIRNVFENTMQIELLKYQNANYSNNLISVNYNDVKENNINKLFSDFFLKMHDKKMSQEEKLIIENLINSLKENVNET